METLPGVALSVCVCVCSCYKNSHSTRKARRIWGGFKVWVRVTGVVGMVRVSKEVGKHIIGTFPLRGFLVNPGNKEMKQV